jgi:hypothetical protein
MIISIAQYLWANQLDLWVLYGLCFFATFVNALDDLEIPGALLAATLSPLFLVIFASCKAVKFITQDDGKAAFSGRLKP